MNANEVHFVHTHSVCKVLSACNEIKYLDTADVSRCNGFSLQCKTVTCVIYCVCYWTVPSSRGHAVVQLVEALHYQPKVHSFDSQCSHWNFSST